MMRRAKITAHSKGRVSQWEGERKMVMKNEIRIILVRDDRNQA